MGYHLWDEVLKFVEVLTKWPPIVLAIAFLFRNRLSSLKLKGKDLEVELELRQALVKLRQFVAESDPKIVKQVAPKLLTALLAELPTESPAKAGSGRNKGKARLDEKPTNEAADEGEDAGSDAVGADESRVDDDLKPDEEQ